MKSARRLGVLVILVGVVITSCVPAQNGLLLGPDSVADSVVFEMTNADGTGPALSWIFGLSVVECGTDRVMWTIAGDGSRSIPSRITYGQSIPGFVARVGPEPLVPGCYKVYVSDARPLRFIVDSTRAVRLPDR